MLVGGGISPLLSRNNASNNVMMGLICFELTQVIVGSEVLVAVAYEVDVDVSEELAAFIFRIDE